jgi:hypothetical protein
MEKKSILTNISRPNITADIIAVAIRGGILTFKEALETGEFQIAKQKLVKDLLAQYQEEDTDFINSTTLPLLREFIAKYPGSTYKEQAYTKIREKEAEERENQRQEFEKIKNNIDDYKPDEAKKKIGEEFLKHLCSELGIDYDVFNNYDEPDLKFNDIPKEAKDIPEGFTDVFFWGIPSSGKTCALSAILCTMKEHYTIASPAIEKKFGATYRDSLINIFKNHTAYLPGATQKDRTQYMPLLLKKRNEEKYRKISFFELSGEVFKYFYELENNCNILDDVDRSNVESAFETLNLLLGSKNQKIHFFFIDYQQETKGTKDKHNLTQENYLNAAATYFRDKEDIFKKKTDAVYVVVTKSDKIKSFDNNKNNISGEERTQLAGKFLSDNFGNFMDVIKHRCKKDSVDFNVKIFSIGDVFFKSICKINYYYSTNIVEDLLKKVKPVNENRITNWFNS